MIKKKIIYYSNKLYKFAICLLYYFFLYIIKNNMKIVNKIRYNKIFNIKICSIFINKKICEVKLKVKPLKFHHKLFIIK
jgi:hypothetical protein